MVIESNEQAAILRESILHNAEKSIEVLKNPIKNKFVLYLPSILAIISLIIYIFADVISLFSGMFNSTFEAIFPMFINYFINILPKDVWFILVFVAMGIWVSAIARDKLENTVDEIKK